MEFTDGAARSTAVKTLERNSYFAHPESVLLSMLSDEDYQVRCIAVNKILAIRGVQEFGRVVIPANVFEGGINAMIMKNHTVWLQCKQM